VNLSSAPVVDESVFEEMKRYVRFTEADAALLAELLPHAEPHFEQIAADFYERIREHERAHAVFSGEEQVRRLQRSLTRWLQNVCAGPFDEAFFEETAKIGRVHVRVGLPQHYMFTAMALIRVELSRIADEALGERAAAARGAVDRVLDLELAIMLEAYRDDLVARVERINRMEREQVGRTLAQTAHRYGNAVELARVLVVGLDARATIGLFNREAERVTGFAREEAHGASFVDLLLPEDLRDTHGRLLGEAAAGGPLEVDVLESAVRTRTGKIRDVRWQLAYSRAEGDEVVLFAIGQDLTEQNALAARVLKSEKLAAAGTLAAGLAHEIRNPLNGAQLHLTVLERGLTRSGAGDPDALEAVQIVRQQIQRLSGLVTEFLGFARPRPLMRAPTSLRALCERLSQVMAADAQAAGVELRHELPRADLVLDLDAARMEQVLLNLMRNAIEAMAPAGGGALTCRAFRQPRSAVIEIEDSGPGVPAPDAPIFDPFYSTKPHGTGLGLAIAHRIVTDHDGTIDVNSRPGRTIFRVTLPLPASG
jgi:PAS domain S-box-containing protein